MEWALHQLIGEARDRQRRRRQAILVAATAVLVGALLLARGGGPSGGSPEAGVAAALEVPPGTVWVSAARVIPAAQPPYMGVHCRVANSIACERVGLAVWLRHPARAVRATIDGHPLALDWLGEERRITGVHPRTAFTGYLTAPRLFARLGVISTDGYWYGNATPSPTVALLIDVGRDHYVATRLAVPLMAGWG